jgi:hypothetical protein
VKISKQVIQWAIVSSTVASTVPLRAAEVQAAEPSAKVDSAANEGQRQTGDIARHLMVGLDTRLLHASYAVGDAEQTTLTLGLSVGSSTPWLSFGYGLSHNWLLSGSLSVQHSDVSNDSASNATTTISLAPAVSHVFGSGAVRPYLGIQTSLTRATSSFDYFGAGGGAHGGMRLEVSDHLSLEPRVTADYAWSRADGGCPVGC